MSPDWDLSGHHEAVQRAHQVQVRVFHAMGPDTFTVSTDGEMSLMDRDTLIRLLRNLTEQESGP